MTNSSTARQAFDRELTALRDNVLRLTNMTDTAIERAMQAMVERDESLAKQVVIDDKPINRMRYDIEEECYRLIATQQPLARDMRTIITAIHIVVELERIADHAAGIAKIALELGKEPPLKPLIDLPRMAKISREMLRDTVDAYLTWDAVKAQEITERDDEVDMLDSQVYRELISYMIQDPRNISRATYLLWASHNLERIADRITNICERIIFMVTGNIKKKKKNKPVDENDD
ncbi:MAG: phosphate signaling complex protein PhoU [Chloroflexi bacterium]|nr:phosphate signaling complex protein PhoU [Chloroflexota bacterium]